jgi:hypothetical protein
MCREGGEVLNGMQVNQVGAADGESSNGKATVDGVVGFRLDRSKDSVDGFRRDFPYEGASSLTRPTVKDDVVDVPGTAKPTTINGYYLRSSSSAPLTPSSALLAARIQTRIFHTPNHHPSNQTRGN